MRVSKLFGMTLREMPAEVDIASHQWLLRAGYVRQLATGIFSFLPLAQRALQNIEQILREEMNAIGGQEINMPVVHPAEPWQQTGRWEDIDATMVRFQDRRGRDMLLAMTHEEVVAELARSEIRSYRQLPLLIYQLQTKFRDELRSRGGLIRLREFVMKDSYSLDRNQAGLQQQYIAHYNAYFRIGARVGLPLTAVQSDVGMMGGRMAHEFMYLTPIGEDNLLLCPQCHYAANQEVAEFHKPIPPTEPARPLEKVATPGTKTIASLAQFLDIGAEQTGKVVFLVGTTGPEAPSQFILAVVRGDMEVNPVQVANLARVSEVRPAQEEEIAAAGAVAGYASPIGLDRSKVTVIVDDLVAASPNLVMGANEPEHHLLNTSCGRDYEPDAIGSIAAAYEGAPCIRCASPLTMTRGVEIGNIFQLGTRYSAAMGAVFTDENGAEQPVIMGSYGIGVARLLACIAEAHHDDKGLVWPISVAPYQVNLVSLAKTETTTKLAEDLYIALQREGIQVLFDDRDLNPGIKLVEADLRGMPLRLLISERSVKNGQVELKRRTASAGTAIPLDLAVATTVAEIAALRAELAAARQQAPVWSGEKTAES